MLPSLPLGRRSRALWLALLAVAGGGCGSSGDVTIAPQAKAAPRTSAPAAPPPLSTGRLPGTATPLRYALSLVVDPTKERFLGNVIIDLDVPAPTPAIVLHGRDLVISSAEILADGRTVTARASTRMAVGGKDTPDELVLTTTNPIPAGRAQLRVSYSGGLEHALSGLYRVKDGADFYAFTQFEPTDARRMFPCFDEPGFKVPFDVKVTTPKENLVVANTEEIGRTTSEDGTSLTFSFATTARLPTYLIALGVGPFQVREGPQSPVKLRLITPRGKAALGDLALEAAAAIVPLLSQYFDRPYPYSKLDLMAVPEFGYGAMENAGLITFREDLLLLDPQTASAQARRGMVATVAHEITHHWFGNLVTMQWWDDLWLNEGFTTWMEAKVVDTWRPSMEARLEELSDKAWVMDLDALSSVRAVRQPVASTSEALEAIDSTTYDKGSAVLGMLESWLGPNTFRDGVRAYIKAHEHGNATASDLLQELSRVSGKDVVPVASSFLDQPGVPLVRASLACAKGKEPKVTLTHARYRAGGGERPEEAAWKIPICIAYEGGAEGAPACGLIDGPKAEITIGGGKPADRCPKWIYPNAGEAGYFRFALPKAEQAALMGAAKALDVRSRIGLLSNAWALVQSGDMQADALLDLLVEMKGERHRLVLDQVIENLQRISQSLIDDAMRPAFRAYASSILLPIAKELGWDAKKGESDEQKLMRRRVFTALATLAEDPWLYAEAEKRAAAYLRDPRAVDADTATIALRVSSRKAGEARFAELEGALLHASTPEGRTIVLGALGSLGSPPLLRRALDLLSTGKIKIHEGFPLISSAASWPDSQKPLLAWVKESFPELKKRIPGFVLARFAGLASMICESAARDEAATFFGAALKDVEGSDRPLQQALEASSLCIDLRAREGARVKKRLTGGKRGG